MVTQLGRLLGMGLEMLLDVIAREFLKTIVVRSGHHIPERRRDNGGDGKKAEFQNS
jgi:hypothetical protein